MATLFILIELETKVTLLYLGFVGCYYTLPSGICYMGGWSIIMGSILAMTIWPGAYTRCSLTVITSYKWTAFVKCVVLKSCISLLLGELRETVRHPIIMSGYIIQNKA